MKMEKVPMNGYDALLYKTDKYTTIHLNMFFELEYTKENITLCDLLAEYMINTNKKYKGLKDIRKRRRELYNASFGISNYNLGDKMFVEINFVFFDPKLVKDDYAKEAIIFAHDMLFNPNFDDGKLDSDVIKIIKNNMIGSIANSLVEPRTKAYSGFTKASTPNTFLSEDIFDTKEEYSTLLESFTPERIISFYENLINEHFVKFTIMGNVDDKMLDMIKSNFQFKNIKTLESTYFNKLHVTSPKQVIKVKDKDINESTVFSIYDIKNYTIEKRYIFNMIIDILNSGGSVMRNILRDEYKIVYSSGATFNALAGLFMLRSNIDRKNYKKCIEAYDKVLNKMKDRDFIESILPKIKEKFNLIYYTHDEDKWNIVNDLFNEALNVRVSVKEQNEIYNAITVEDILREVNNLEHQMIYFYEGAKKNE